MTTHSLTIGQYTVPIHSLNTVVVGTGAAGYNAANRLYQLGRRDIAMVTEGVNTGTSRNTGSDKQTYYKLSLAGDDDDSVRRMAGTLYAGQCTDGDLALCEAALSAQCFLNLVELGVPFPRTRYGEFVGYKTDHDPYSRGTSVGPYTSKMMTECLQKAVEQKGIEVYDKLMAVRILTNGSAACGLLCLDLAAAQQNEIRFVAFNCTNIVYATGGAAGIYADSVYPAGHFGASGLAFECGAKGKNLTEWQYGLASKAPRWNVSGTYMQVLPRFVSTDAEGGDEREFLCDFFTDTGEMLDMVFLKGYQWPFDVRKVQGGSSIIDILVYIENSKGRRVWLDFRRNPGGGEVDFSALSAEVYGYLDKAEACFGTPLQRLEKMNSPAVDFYRDKGVDLASQPLEIALCAQHNNGGLAINDWWQTDVEGLFAAGEVTASHGVYRPGGSALNAGQVGSLRAAQYIAARRAGAPLAPAAFSDACTGQIEQRIGVATAVLSNFGPPNAAKLFRETGSAMNQCGGPIRAAEKIRQLAKKCSELLARFPETVSAGSPKQLPLVYRLRDALISQVMYLNAMENYIEKGGKSRGSALYTDPAEPPPHPSLPAAFAFKPDDGRLGDQVQQLCYNGGSCDVEWRPVRPIPEDDAFFENVWRSYRESQNITD